MPDVGFAFDEMVLKHRTGPLHPERAERLEHLMEHLRNVGLLSELTRVSVEQAALRWIETVHSRAYIEKIRTVCESGGGYLDPDTVVSGPESYQAALVAVGAALSACDAVMVGEVDQTFCAVRPPGHHAEPERAMGFCLFNTVAVATRYLQSHHHVGRVAIIDWDVHHGNGTQAAFYEDDSVLYISVHQHPLFPGTGRAEERGRGKGEGTTLNVPLPPGCVDDDYVDVFERKVVPTVQGFKPEFILISAGFDAHREDPLANMQLTEAGFRSMTSIARTLAAEEAGGRLIASLEGGYNLKALGRSVETHIRTLQD